LIKLGELFFGEEEKMRGVAIACVGGNREINQPGLTNPGDCSFIYRR